MTYPRRLIEVDLPIRRISAHARREKDMRLGHIPSLHIYPAARPVAACRAIVCTTLWPDPADAACPEAFRVAVQELLTSFARVASNDRGLYEMCDKESMGRYVQLLRATPQEVTPEMLRGLLLDFVADYCSWEASINKTFLLTAREITKVAHKALGGASASRPLIVDSFAGGGAIPLEALRSGADAYASDLNPLSVILNKVILEFVPKYGARLSDELRKWCEWSQKEIRLELGEFYRNDNDGSTPIAYLWARTVRCEGPGCGKKVPLMRSFWLARKNRKAAAIPEVTSTGVHFQIAENPNPKHVPDGTIKKGSATCLSCGYTTPVTSVRRQLSEQRGASDQSMLYAVVIDSPIHGRTFRAAEPKDLEIVENARRRLKELSQRSIDPPLVPTESLPPDGTLGFRIQKYGMCVWADLFNSRQLLALTTYARLSKEYAQSLDDPGLSAAVNACTALIVDRLVDLNAALCVWQLNTRNTAHVFGRWAVPMNWDYGEVNPLAAAGGSPESAVRRMIASISNLASADLPLGQAEQGSADNLPLPDDSASAFITDPPYYDAMPYSDLLDFFYVWLKRSLTGSLHSLFASEHGPKEKECIVDQTRGKDSQFYKALMVAALAEGRRILSPSAIGVIVFAHKSTAGWEALLEAVVEAGFVITGSWPLDTEMASRLRAKGSAALASSVHLVCRARDLDYGSSRGANAGDWRDVLAELPRRIHEWLPRLADEGVVGADAIFACLGPALEIFSRYSYVEKASGEQVSLRDYLEHVWAAVSQEALRLVFEGADASGFEEDSRLTAMWLWTLRTGNGTDNIGPSDDETEEAYEEEGKRNAGGYILEYDAARKIAQGLGAHLEGLLSVVAVEGETARLLPVSERTAYLFGQDQADAPVAGKKKGKQLKLAFEEELENTESSGRWGEKGSPKVGITTLDRVHQSMILFAAGRSEALRRYLVEEGVGSEGRLWTLSQALSALYPVGSDEKRWVDGVLARKKGLGL